MVKENSPISEQQYFNSTNSLSSAASKSLKDLINSLSQEQIFNQDLLLSLTFALRSFTNLQRFFELIPLLVTQLVGVKGSLLIPFQDNGILWREQLQMFPIDQDQEIFRQLLLLEAVGQKHQCLISATHLESFEGEWVQNSQLMQLDSFD